MEGTLLHLKDGSKLARIPRGMKLVRPVVQSKSVTLHDYGGHARIYVNAEEYGYINYDTNYSSDFPSLDMPPHSIYLRWMIIRHDERRQGFGSEAYKEFENILCTKGVRAVLLHPKNPRAARFWQRQGFSGNDAPEDHEEGALTHD